MQLICLIYMCRTINKSVWGYFVLNQKQFLTCAGLAVLLFDLGPQILNQPTVAFHIKLNLCEDILGWKLGLTESQQNLALGAIRPRNNFLRFPGNFIILQTVGSGYGLTVKYHKILIQVHIDIKLIYLILPFLVHLVLEGKLNVTTVYLHRVNEQKRYFILVECFCFYDVIYEGF